VLVLVLLVVLLVVLLLVLLVLLALLVVLVVLVLPEWRRCRREWCVAWWWLRAVCALANPAPPLASTAAPASAATKTASKSFLICVVPPSCARLLCT
jgi:hypothetical protein